MTKKEILQKIDELEKKQEFHTHIVPPMYDKIKAVDENFDYIRKDLKNKIGSFFCVQLFKLISLFIAPYCKLKIVGKENLKGVKGAVVTCNHINDIDCVLIKRALLHQNLKITVAEFNNFKGVFGSILRGAGTMPLSTTNTLRKFSEGVNFHLQKGRKVLFYPEVASWWCYEKPRPLMNGAFRFSVKNNVPIIPMFFTFRNLKLKQDGTFKKQFVLHIGKPIYPNNDISNRDSMNLLLEETFNWNKSVYESFYGRKLSYLVDDSENK